MIGERKDATVIRSYEPGSSLFVYGSLIDPVHRVEIIGREVEAVPATIKGYERGHRRHFYLRKQDGVETQGFLLVGLTAADFEVLDQYEEVPVLYTRESAEVIDENGATVRCFLYLPTDQVIATD
jgi:gamma-glutamylcyclotransferase (GGCT)/AIG2-like uncharacterized protein YtfP